MFTFHCTRVVSSAVLINEESKIVLYCISRPTVYVVRRIAKSSVMVPDSPAYNKCVSNIIIIIYATPTMSDVLRINKQDFLAHTLKKQFVSVFGKHISVHIHTVKKCYISFQTGKFILKSG